jgi:hypothetical protein
MTNLEILVHLATTLLPILSAFAFLLLHRHQSIRAELEEQRIRQIHCEQATVAKTERVRALSAFATTFAPMVGPLLEKLFDDASAGRSPSDMSDDELLAELDRRFAERGSPLTVLDDVLEHLWATNRPDSPDASPDAPPDAPPEAEDLRAEAS